MDLASFCSLPLGVLRWTAVEPRLTVFVKATFSIAEDGEAILAEQQEPLTLDEPDPKGDASGLVRSSDFVPKKGRADVVLVGHAHAAEPTTAIPGRITIDVFDKEFVARAGVPSRRIPLGPSHLRASVEPAAPAVSLGPRAPWAPERAVLRGGAAFDARGLPTTPLGDRFDFEYFNAAPPDQRINLLRPNGTIVLDGLVDGASQRTVQLPGHRPRVFHLGKTGPGARASEIALVSDTLWIDVDRAICTLTWRGVVPLDRVAEPPTLLVLSLEPRGAAQSWESLRGLLGASLRTRAIEATDLALPESADDTPPPDSAPTNALMTLPKRPEPAIVDEVSTTAVDEVLDDALLLDDDPTDEPSTAGQRAPSPGRAATQRLDATMALELDPKVGWPNREPTPDAPFHEPQPAKAEEPEAPAPRKRAVDLTRTVQVDADTESTKEALPFRRPLMRLASFVPAPSDADTESDADTPDADGPAVAPDHDGRTIPHAEMKRMLTLPFKAAESAVERTPLPFVKAAPPAEERTGVIDPALLRSATVPFRPGASPMSVPTSGPAHTPRPARNLEDETRPVDIAALALARSRAVPFDPDEPPTFAKVPAIGLRPAEPLVSVPTPEASIEHVQKAPNEPRAARMPLDSYADLKAQLWAEPTRVDHVLAAARVTDVEWAAAEETYAEAIRAELAEGKSDLARAVRAAIEGRAPAAKPGDALSLVEFVALRVELEGAEDPGAVLVERGLTDSDWRRVRRAWNGRAKREPSIAEELERTLREARERQRGAHATDGHPAAPE